MMTLPGVSIYNRVNCGIADARETIDAEPDPEEEVIMKRRLYAVIATVIALMLGCIGLSRSVSRAQTWVLAWSDEFDGPADSLPDASKWTAETGGNGWGNNELEYYTARAQNASTDGQGNLVIRALKEDYTGPDHVSRSYTSARLISKGKFSRKFGKIEARIKLPFGQGIWPAFWMLGNDIDSAGWPTCGEIDIMENIGREPSTVHGSLHGPGYSGGSPLTGSYALAAGQRLSDDFHVFSIEWEPTAIRFYVDGNLYETRTPADVPSGTRWVYDHPFFILLNCAVGGSWPGSPDGTTTWPQPMTIDYVRVYTDSSIDYSPHISGTSVSGKDLLITGERFDGGAVILLNGEEQKTRFDDQNPSILIGKKVWKKIKKLDSGQMATIKVTNSDGSTSNEVLVPRN
jgi:beta-glucanase (GH16 family)